MEEEAEEILFEAWFYKLKASGGQARLRLSSAWVKRYCILRRIDDRAILQYHKTKPDSLDENPQNRYELWPTYKIEKHRNLHGKPFIIQVMTSLTRLTLSTDDESMFHLFAFFLQTQTQLLDLDNSSSTYVVRPENSEEHQCLGSRGSMCILHVTEWGVILALELSRCVMAFWPLKSIKSYETSGKGQFGLEIGRNSTTGPGNFVFNTRLSQDIAIYNTLDSFVNSAVELRQSTDGLSDFTAAGEYKKLQQFTTAKSNGQFTSQLKRISRNIHDPLLQLLGGTNQRRQASTNDLSGESTLTGRRPASERSNNSMAETPTPARPPAFDFEAQNAKLHRTPPPAYHRYSNEEMIENDTANAAGQQSPDNHYLLVNKPNQTSKRELNFDGNQTIPKTHTDVSPAETPSAGMTAALPSFHQVTTWPRLHRLASRSAEDLSEHTRAANFYAYNNNTFQPSEAGSPSVYSEDGDSTGHIIYSYTIPSQLKTPQQLVRQRSQDVNHDPILGARVRRSMSNPNILGSQLDQIVPPDQYDDMRRPELPVRPSFLNIQKHTPAENKPTSIQGISLTSHTRSFRKIPGNGSPSPSPSDTTFHDQRSTMAAPAFATMSTQPPMLTKLGPRVTNAFPAGRQESSHLFQFLQANSINSQVPIVGARPVFHPNTQTYDNAGSGVAHTETRVSNVSNHITTVSTQSAGAFAATGSITWNSHFRQVQSSNVSAVPDVNKNITVQNKVKTPMDETMC